MRPTLAVLLVVLGTASLPQAQEKKAAPVYPFRFRDVTAEVGLLPAIGGSRGHAAAWGDVDGSGWPSLWMGTYHTAGKPGQLFRNARGKFRLDDQEHVRVSACASGAVFADLGNTGRLDLFVAGNAHGKDGVRSKPSQLFRNDGGGKLVDVSKDSGACPPGFQGRTVIAADFDGDGKLDLLACEYYYSAGLKKGVALYRNTGGHRFEDVAAKVGLPQGRACPGAAVADFDGDGWPDIFLTVADGTNRLLLNDGKGNFREAPGTRGVFAWKHVTPNDPPTGVCVCDINRDGLPDLVVGHHFKQPWQRPVAVRIYLNRGSKDGVLVFEDVTEKVGMVLLAMKAPHVEFQDLDNDGWPDIHTGIVKFRDGVPYPIIFHHRGVDKDGLPRFQIAGWDVNDFPSAADLAVKRTGPFFDRLLKEKKIVYSAAAPAVDYDRDGRTDLFLSMWWESVPAMLLRNETAGGHWLSVSAEGGDGVNRQGVGALVRVYRVGQLGRPAGLLGIREIATSRGWCSGQEARVHFGLGAEKSVDVELTWPHGKGRVVERGVAVNRHLTVRRPK